MEKRFRIALAGCGGMSNAWIDILRRQPDVEIVALCDIIIERAHGHKQKYALDCGAYERIADAIRESGANTVVDTTTPDAHELIASTALTMGLDVMSEKPMAENLPALLRLNKLAQTAGRSYAIMQNRRYNPVQRRFQRMVRDGALGRPAFLTAEFFIGAHFGGFRDLMDDVLLLDMAIHSFDQARAISGKDCVAVYCHAFNPAGSWYKGCANASAVFEMEDGVVFTYNGSWCAEGVNTSWECAWRMQMENGTIYWDGNQTLYADTPDPAQPPAFIRPQLRVTPDIPDCGPTGHEGCITAMLEAMRTGGEAETCYRNNLNSMAMVFGAIESAKQRRRVEISELMNRSF